MSPFKSEAQRRLFYSAAAGKAKKGPSAAVAKKFIKHAGSSKSADLPKRVGQRKKA